MKSRSRGRFIIGGLALASAILLTTLLAPWGDRKEMPSPDPVESVSVGRETVHPQVPLAPAPNATSERVEALILPDPTLAQPVDNTSVVPEEATEVHNFRLVTADGAAVLGCLVRLSLGSEAQELISDPHGCFTFESPVHAPWEFEANSEEELRSGVIGSKTMFPRKTDPQDIVLFSLQRVTCQVVLGDGSGIPGAAISVRPIGQMLARGTPRPLSVSAGPEGAFELQLEVPGFKYELNASLGELESGVLEFRPEDYVDAMLKVQLSAPAGANVLVVEPAGKPCAGARVKAFSHWTGNMPAGRQSSHEWVTDEHGFANLSRSGSQSLLLVAEHDDWRPSTPAILAKKGSSPEGLIRLQLAERSLISGVLVWEDGSPAPGAQVVALRDERDDASSASDAIPPSHDDLIYGFWVATTDEQGEFEFTEIRKGLTPYRLYCTPDSSLPDRHQWHRGVLPGTTDLKVVLLKSQLIGSVLEAKITVGESEAVLEEVLYFLYEKRADGVWGTVENRSMSTPDGVLRREGLTPGVEYAMAINPIRGYLAALIPPWKATDEVHTVQASLTVPVFVEFLLPESAPADLGAGFRVDPLESHPHGVRPLLADPDRSGRLRLPLWDGRFRAYVLNAEGERLYETELDIARGSEEMTIQLEE